MSAKKKQADTYTDTAQLRAELTSAMSAPRASVRKEDEKRTGQQAPLPSMPDRRRRRKSVTDIKVTEKQSNLSAWRFVMRSLDAFAVIYVITVGIWNGYIGANNNGIIAPIAAATLGSLFFIGLLILNRAHSFKPTERYLDHMKTVALASTGALGVWLTIALILRPDSFLPDTLAKSGLLATGVLLALHTLYYMHIRRLHENHALAPTIVMLGATESARRIIEENARTKELNILAIFDDRIARAPHDIHGVPVVGKVEDLLAWDKLPFINRIVVTLPSMAAKRKQAFVEQVRLLPNRIAFVVDEFETLNHVRQRVSEIAEVSLRDVTGSPKSGRHTALKRVTDIALSSIALVLGAPILLLISIMIKIDSPGPVIFKQQRHGFNNRIFYVYKFRSMKKESEDLKAERQVTHGDDRVTKLGRFIRKTSLDELPQLLNVLKGEMSLVGPRPHAVGMRTNGKDSMELVEEYAHRHKVKPGMTGWAQINGSRGALETAEDIATRVKLDVDYIERSGFFFDLYIMLMTLPVLLGDKDSIR
ncbi:Undecaprenyl-phosphate glucose phosphotransferase [Litorimonas taeanensis]|uniref:Undecaprenyl-phosphate glucose phosphotransferase n=1 Tax=Litorimonas taeanensis TaxID=568099 RepID=A0A420WLV7_9PROT|nr:exopolysaccharide biosynthesis polyprenyl glycosylphosphotransferase [Litorimonas taeanensis]RKQ71902.1 Undecaprenyl-phosphate glucose phosphotransferase [Litorimonas taeanensis]